MTVSLAWVLNFSNAIVGVGLLTMPYCFQQCGIILTTMMVVVSGHLTKITCEFLLRAGSYTRKSTYEQLALLVFGRTGKLLCEISTIGVTVGTLVAFQVVIGDLAPAIITNTLGFGNSWMLRAMLMVASCAFVLPLCLMRKVSSLANLNAVSMTFYVCFIFVVFCLSLPNLMGMEWWSDVYFWKPAEFFKCLPIILLSYNCQAQIFIFYAALPEPNMKTMMAIVDKAINLVNLFYISVGLFGYIAFHKSGVYGDVLENFPSSFLTDLMKLGFLLSVFVSFPLMCFPVRSSINSLLFADKKQSILHDVITNSSGYIAPDKFVMITFGLVSSTVVVGILIPKIEVVLSLTGALAGSFICLVFPSALFVMTGAKDKLRRFGLAVLLVSAFFMITCTATSLSGVISGEPPIAPIQNIEKSGIHPLAVKLIKPGLPVGAIAAPANVELREIEDKMVGKVNDKNVADIKIEDIKVKDKNVADIKIEDIKVKDKNVADIKIEDIKIKLNTNVPPKVLEETKVLPGLTNKATKIKISDVVQPKSDVKQITDLNNALHGKAHVNSPANHKESQSVDKVKTIVVEDLDAHEITTLSNGKLNPAGDFNKNSNRDNQIDFSDTKANYSILKDNKVLNLSGNTIPLSQTSSDNRIPLAHISPDNGISLLETPLEIPAVLNIDENARKSKLNREILSKQ